MAGARYQRATTANLRDAVLHFEVALNNFNPKEEPMDSSDGKINRREFLQKGAVVAAGSTTLSTAALSYARIVGANDRSSLGDIRNGNRGGEAGGRVARGKDTENAEGAAGGEL